MILPAVPRLPTLALPVAFSVPAIFAPVVVAINTFVPFGAKVMLPLAAVINESAPVSTMLPVTFKLSPFTLPVAETNPPVIKLPPVTLPVATT